MAYLDLFVNVAVANAQIISKINKLTYICLNIQFLKYPMSSKRASKASYSVNDLGKSESVNRKKQELWQNAMKNATSCSFHRIKLFTMSTMP